MRFARISTLLAWTASVLPCTSAIKLNPQLQRDELISAANQAKENMLAFYNGDQPGGTPGYMLRPDVYYWWLVGGMLGQLIHHWQLTGNDSSNDLVRTAIQFNSQDNDYLQPKNQSNSEGNDDQMYWALACMDAAESNFPAPDKSTGLSWLGLAQAVFNVQTTRWDTTTCNGGLRWQIYQWNNGYHYKNMPSNGGLFQISARLARYTGNDTYAMWAEKIWDWSMGEKLIGPYNGPQDALHVFDGFGDDKCSDSIPPLQFTYNTGALLMGCAYMYNYTNGNQTWKDRTQHLMNGIANNVFLVGSLQDNSGNAVPPWNGSILSESAMEFQTPQSLNNDQPSFKAYTARWMAVSAQLAPFIAPDVHKILQASAIGAAAQCIGKAPGAESGGTPPGYTKVPAGTGDNWCGRRWYQTRWDGYSGFGEQMSAMSVFQNALTTLSGSDTTPGAGGAPLTGSTGGTSESQPNAGSGVGNGDPNNMPGGAVVNRQITGGDRAGAAFATIIGCSLPLLALWFMFMGGT